MEDLKTQEIVRILRDRAGLSQEALGSMLGMSSSWVRDIETGYIELRPKTVCDLAAILGPSVGHIYRMEVDRMLNAINYK